MSLFFHHHSTTKRPEEAAEMTGLDELHRCLRSEWLLVSNDQAFLKAQNVKLEADQSDFYRTLWIRKHEQMLMQRLINSDPSILPDDICQLFINIECAELNPAHKAFGQNTTDLADAFRLLYESPRVVAAFLNYTDKLDSKPHLEMLYRAVFGVLFGSCVWPEDERAFLAVLGHLVQLQLADADDPRRLLRKGSCAFARMYRAFSEELYSTRVYLTAALHDPTFALLAQEEIFLDLDPQKSPIRFPAAERLRRFGAEQSPKYRERVAEHRRFIVEKLVFIARQFMDSIGNATECCFPASLRWLVRQLYITFTTGQRPISKAEASLICTDLIFTHFLCPALANPEPLGIVPDTPISHVARFNLMQIGQLLQTLAMLPYENAPAYLGDIIAHFDQTQMSTIVQRILCVDSCTPVDSILSITTDAPLDASGECDVFTSFKRRARVGTIAEFGVITSSLKTAINSGNLDTEIVDVLRGSNLSTLLKRLPEQLIAADEGLRDGPAQLYMFTFSQNDGSDEAGIPLGLKSEDEVMQGVSQQQRKNSNKYGASSEKRTRFLTAPTESMVSDSANDDDEGEGESMVLGRSAAEMALNGIREQGEDDNASSSSSSTSSSSSGPDEGDVEGNEETPLPDNLSDLVSANVSGRGSPSLSGRDTPFSNTASTVNDQNDNTCPSNIPAIATLPPGPNRRSIPTIPITVRKPLNNSDVLDDKFGRFALPPQDPRFRIGAGDEAVSMISDSWSTDANGPASDKDENENAFGGVSLSAFGLLVNGGGSGCSIPAISSPLPPPPLHSASLHPKTKPTPVVGCAGGHNSKEHLTVTGKCASFPSSIVIGGGGGGSAERPLPSSSFAVSNNSSRGLFNKSDANGLREAQSTIALSTSALVTATSSSALSKNGHVAENDILPCSLRVLAEVAQPYFNSSTPTQCQAFVDAKRKLRMVLSQAVFAPTLHCRVGGTDEVAQLNQLLDHLLAEALNEQDRRQAAAVREVRRCIGVFDEKSVRYLVRVLKDEHWKRTTHFQLYLQQSRLALLQHSDGLARMRRRVEGGEHIVSSVINTLVRLFLQSRELQLRQFCHAFQQSIAQDEKIELVRGTLDEMYGALLADAVWRKATDRHLELAHNALERALIDRIYYTALYPNGDADAFRDELFYNSVESISSCVQVDHPELSIPKNLWAEAPWQSAQQELAIINAYKCPRDKLSCVIRCCENVQNLVVLGSDGGSASADDILPVLVFVILKTNPPSLLSTIQYIDGYYGAQMQGSESYWWTQFTSGVEFMKQLLNNLVVSS